MYSEVLDFHANDGAALLLVRENILVWFLD